MGASGGVRASPCACITRRGQTCGVPAARGEQRRAAGEVPLLRLLPRLAHCCPGSLTSSCVAGPPCAGSACGLVPPSSLGLHELIYVQDVDGSSTMTASVRGEPGGGGGLEGAWDRLEISGYLLSSSTMTASVSRGRVGAGCGKWVRVGQGTGGRWQGHAGSSGYRTVCCAGPAAAR